MDFEKSNFLKANCVVPQKIGPYRIWRFDVYWIKTNKQKASKVFLKDVRKTNKTVRVSKPRFPERF